MMHQARSSSDDVYVDVCGERSATLPLPPCPAERQSEGQGEKGKGGAYVAPPPLRESPTVAVLSGACDVTRGVPQPEVDSRVNATCCSKDASFLVKD